MAKKRKNNEELVSNMMNYSKFGALSQVMVMQAIEYYTDMVIEGGDELIAKDKADQEKGKIGFINMESWVGVAKEIKEKFELQRAE